MKTLKILPLIALLVLLSSCQTDPVEKYFVDATENGHFFVNSIPTSFIQFDKDSLDSETLKQLQSVKKINILTYYDKQADRKTKEAEYIKANKAIQSKAYKTLTKIKDKNYEGYLSYLGNNHKIDEIIFIGKDAQSNFIVGIIKGDHIDVQNMLKALKHIKAIDRKQIKSMFGMFDQKSPKDN